MTDVVLFPIQSAKSNDIVLIAGKGHETYQEIGHTRFPFSDELEVKLLLLD
jgi:UDP-N-acetylmuramyl tripeptide synthase